MSFKRLSSAFLVIIGLAGAPTSAHSAEIRLLEIDGVINPLTDRYLEREIRSAETEGAQLLIIRLNTPGGLESSMREMVLAMLGAKVPIAVHVAPPGARAASAGMFITIAAHIAVMAPGTNIGAAHPVAIGESPSRSDAPPRPDAAIDKAVNDAAALARSTATLRGRSAQWAESSVRKSVSITASEALQNNVIDLIVESTDDLLTKLDARRVRTASGDVTLRTRGATVVKRPMNFAERAMHVLTDPNIAYLLMTIGIVGVIAELYSPGMGFPGIIGVISLLLSFAGLGSLPINWAGVLLIALAIGLFIAELMTPGIGFLAVGGLIAFVIGSLMLYTPLGGVSPAMPTVHVNRWLLMAVVVLVTAFFLLVVRALMRARKLPVAIGSEAMIGKEGRAVTPIAPYGRIRISGELWSAEAEPEAESEHPAPIRSGDPVIVTKVEGVTVKVRRETTRKAS